MTFCLNSIIIKPEEGTEIKNAIVLLHGYGGDGKDISMLTLNWKRHLPNTIFICPNGHERCAINPSGYQWFDLTKEDPSYILEESIKAENVIKKFIEEAQELIEEDYSSPKELARRIDELESLMLEHANKLEFEEAANIRDQISVLKEKLIAA